MWSQTYYDKQLCGHFCCKNENTSDAIREGTKIKREDTFPYKDIRSNKMSTFIEEVNSKQDLLPSSGFSMRLKHSVSSLQDFSYNPTSYKPSVYTSNDVMHELPSPRSLESKNDLVSEINFDFFPEDFDIDDDVKHTPLPQNEPPPVSSVTPEPINESTHTPCNVKENTNKSADSRKLNSSLSDDFEIDFFRSKRMKLFGKENTFEVSKLL